MKKLVSSVLVALTMLLVLGSCGSTKNVAYFQNADSISWLLQECFMKPRLCLRTNLQLQ